MDMHASAQAGIVPAHALAIARSRAALDRLISTFDEEGLLAPRLFVVRTYEDRGCTAAFVVRSILGETAGKVVLSLYPNPDALTRVLVDDWPAGSVPLGRVLDLVTP